MKLLTEMQDGCVHANGYCVDEDNVELRQATMLVHDAACAHALMLAMEDQIAKWGDGTCALDTAKDLFIKRASELMREWGFDSGEGE